jgi:hypothetical protein
VNDIRGTLIAAGVRNLQEYGYPAVTPENIMTDRIYSAFFKSMLNDNLGHSASIDAAIKLLLSEIPE